ncbi:MAG: response regulator [Myxococcales bacterium]|nr:response regulator [Myxococcales bacterium]MCB9579963.1 response regulator [Polyangiaceae bacterium]
MSGLVLFVDDDEANLVVCEAALGDDFDVQTASSAADALKVFEERDVAVLVTDQRMPGVTGVELCEQVKERSPDTIRILITAYSDLKAAIDAINRGQVRRYLKKPWEPDELAAEIRDALHLYEMTGQLRRMERRLVETERLYALGVVAAGIAHELRNPLGVALSNLEILRGAVAETKRAIEGGSADPRRVAALVKEIDDSVADTRFAMDRIMDVVRGIEMPARPAASKPELVDLANVVRMTLQLVNREIVKRASVELDARGPHTVTGSASKLGQIVLNLVVNALQALGDRPYHENKISILIRNAGGKVELDVADNGPGIPEGALKRIFDPFYTTKEEAGTGLGLAISKTIAQEHGGDLTAENLSSGGARFRLSLPATE